jgi:dTDP-4-amino-4,6-dideoxygalactose transaminase
MGIPKPITISLSPNIEKDDICLAFKLLFNPWKWKKGEAVKELEDNFKRYLGVEYAFSFNSGRSALMAILYSLGLNRGDEVLLQAFTCNAVVNPILDRGANPVFVDIDDTINMAPEGLKRKITSRAMAIVVQHNFGWPARVGEISKIAKQNNLYLIEDGAHALGAKYQGQFCGVFGDAAFFSFGRDKIISSVFGGMAVTNNKKIAEKIKQFQDKISYPSNFWIFQQLLHPVLVNYFVLPAYGIHSGLGRIVLGGFHKLSILSKAVYKEEKKGKISRHFPKKMPNVLTILALNQLRKLERFNNHRRKIAGFYQKNLKGKYKMPLAGKKEGILPTFMRFPVLTDKDTDEILRKAGKRKIYLNDGWRKSPVVPLDSDVSKMRYVPGSCPKAEKIAKEIINLPTHINISEKDAERIVRFLELWI